MSNKSLIAGVILVAVLLGVFMGSSFALGYWYRSTKTATIRPCAIMRVTGSKEAGSSMDVEGPTLTIHNAIQVDCMNDEKGKIDGTAF